jgi:hypothetical protein
MMKWWPGRELNPRHADFQPVKGYTGSSKSITCSACRTANPAYPGTILAHQISVGHILGTRRRVPFTASSQRPCHSPRRTPGCRAYVRPRAPSGPPAVTHDRPLRQSSPLSSAVSIGCSWTALQQFGFGLRILVHRPMICQGLIHIKEIGPAPLKSAYHVGARNIMAALPNAGSNPT